MTPRFRPSLGVALLAALLRPATLGAQADSALPAPPRTMGLPLTWHPYVAVGSWMIGGGRYGPLSGSAVLGLRRDLTNPVLGFLGLNLEAYGGWRRETFEGGGRLLAASPFWGVHGGIDVTTRGAANLVFGISEPLRRGGLVMPGDNARIDWLPGRGALSVSLTFPVFEHHMGRTRPRRIDAPIPPAPHRFRARLPADSALEAVLALVRREAEALDHLVVPLVPAGSPDRMRAEDSSLVAHLGAEHPAGPPRTVTGELLAYHDALDRAFLIALQDTSAAGRDLARRVADGAREQLLDHFLIPFDRTLGQVRKPAMLHALAARAADRYDRWLSAETEIELGVDQAVAARGVFEAVLGAIIDVALGDWARWGDTRLGWLPLQLALRPEASRTQRQLDQLIGRMTGQDFAGGHDIVYATDERFQAALLRSVLETRDYHVLWIHDIAGLAPSGRPDSITQALVEAYLARLTRAAREFQRTGTVPSLIVFLDQYYFGRRRSALWLSLLQDPLGSPFSAPGPGGEVEARIRGLQDTLRAAIEASPVLRAAARADRGWIRRTFRIQVNVTHPPDRSFRMRAGLGWLVPPFADDVMRDHRKIVFSDITEADPGRGVAILTGLGVGESYSRYRWFDRTLVLRGPAAVGLKSAARALLLSQGFEPSEIPAALWPDDPTPAYPARLAELERLGWTARVAIATNEVGFGAKGATVLKAALYSLMPPGSTIIVSDAEWSGRFWAGMLLGAALRGGHVLLIGPGPDNAPFGKAFPQTILMRELFERLAEAREILGAATSVSSGSLHLGLFRLGLGTHNVAGGVRAMRDGLTANPFLREALPFSPEVWNLFLAADSLVAAFGDSLPRDTASTYHPAFHLKVGFFGSAEAMREAVGRPEWREFFARRIRERLGESPAGTDILPRALAPLQPYLTGRTEAERDRQTLFLTVGSHNQDHRSLALDGEVMAAISGASSLIAAGDMLLVASVGVDWLDSPARVAAAFPDIRGWRRTLTRLVEQFF